MRHHLLDRGSTHDSVSLWLYKYTLVKVINISIKVNNYFSKPTHCKFILYFQLAVGAVNIDNTTCIISLTSGMLPVIYCPKTCGC